ncbi:MAG: hypothetical protein NVS3B26_06550 [Mycobacteriales bacterium]
MLALVLVFVAVEIVEVWILIQVGHAIGGWQTLALLLLDSVLGAALVRHQGRQTWRAFRQALHDRRVPAREVADGALVLVGGTLLVTPGFLSDVVGVVCLLPPTRALLRPLLTRFLARRLGLPDLPTLAGRLARPRRSTSTVVVDGSVVDGSVVDGSVVDGSVVDGSVVDGSVAGPENVVGSGNHNGPPPNGRRP